MTETLKDNRAVFPPGRQRVFLEHVLRKMPVTDMAHACHCSERTIREWRRERFSMPLRAVRTLATKASVPIPRDISIRDAYAHTSTAGKIGIAAVVAKYGRIPHNEKHRKEQWRLWWESTGRFEKNPILEAKPIRKPRKSTSLAEFIGIMMGDGGLSEYQAVVTLHHVDDFEYASYVTELIEKLFRVKPRIYHLFKKSVNNIVVSRKELVQYSHELGLPIGNKVKQQFDIPEWIKLNQNYSIACLRGLVDTDGCVFTHKYRVKGTWYAYKKLSFTSASKPLRQSIHDLLRKLEFHPRMAGEDVRLDRVEDMKRYFKLIGSHNPKHLRRYESTLG
ncbi:MAG TPA: LAGLIDADG family homing endonuclease [Candidatus Paceibacterota bacterium]|nr:LAGLIDADG family homing endonuclease [Candidatus Paceibacterota bacterium]